MSSIQVQNLTQDEVMKFNASRRWVTRLEMKNKKLTKSNLANRKSSLTKFCKFHNMTPDEFIEEALKDAELGETRIHDWYSSLENKVSENARTAYCWSIIRGFYRHNKINTQNYIGKRMGLSEVKNVDRQLPLFKHIIEQDDDGNDVILERTLNHKLVNSFFRKLSERDELIGSLLMCSGLDIGEILTIPLKKILSQPRRKKIFWEDPRSKNGGITRTFFCTSCTKKIREYIRKFRLDADDREPVFIISKQSQRTRMTRQRDLSNLALNVHDIELNFKEGFTQLNNQWKKNDEVREYLENKDEPHYVYISKYQQQPLRPKRFRGVFVTACKAAGIDDTYIDIMTGANGKHSKSYSEDEIESLEILHNLVEGILSLEPKSKKNSKLEKEFEDYKKETDAKIADMQRQHREDVTDELDDTKNKRIEEILREHNLI